MSKLKQKPSVFETTDGEEFQTKEEAERHQERIDAFADYEHSIKRLTVAFAQSLTTADGKPFQFGGCDHYWYISRRWPGWPELVRMPYTSWTDRLSMDGDRVFVVREDWNNGKHDVYRFEISRLYESEKAAKAALLAAREEYLKEQEEQVDKLRQEIGGGR